MYGRNRIIVIITVAVVVVAVVAALYSLSVTNDALERQIRTRWGLSRSQIDEIRRIVDRYRRGEMSPPELESTLIARFREWGFAPPPTVIIPDLELFYTVKSVISSVNIVLVLSLLLIYVNIYRRTGASFALGLIIFSLALFFYTVSSNPFIQTLFGFRAFGLGPFATLPDIFALIALTILLYLSLK